MDKLKVNVHQFNRFYNIIYLYSGDREKILKSYHKVKLKEGRKKLPLYVIEAMLDNKIEIVDYEVNYED